MYILSKYNYFWVTILHIHKILIIEFAIQY